MIDLGTSKSTFGCPCSATTDLETHGFDDLVICFVFPMGSPNWWILYREKKQLSSRKRSTKSKYFKP
jgi:hypothetical protein